MHKWLPIKNYFVSIKISLTNLVFELIIQRNFYSPNGRDSSKNVEIFKNNTTFLIIFTNMFRRYIRDRQCDGYESLQ